MTNNTTNKPLTPTMEDYLEAIYNISKEKRVVRVKDIAKRLDVKMPTVTNMLKTLSNRSLINYEKYEYLELTAKGADVGKEMNRRHLVFREFLVNILKIDPERADGEACKMEHAVSPSTLDSLVDFMEFLQVCPRAGSAWLDYFDEYRLQGKDREKCIERMKKFANGFENNIQNLNIMSKKKIPPTEIDQGKEETA